MKFLCGIFLYLQDICAKAFSFHNVRIFLYYYPHSNTYFKNTELMCDPQALDLVSMVHMTDAVAYIGTSFPKPQ